MKIYIVSYLPIAGEYNVVVGAALDYDAAQALVTSFAEQEGLDEDFFSIETTELYGEHDAITQDDLGELS